MAIRQAIVPMVFSGVPAAWRPKYVSGLIWRCHSREGSKPVGLVTVDLTPAQAVMLASRADAIVLPTGIDDGPVNITTAQRAALKAMFLPARGATWNEVRRDIVDAFQVARVVSERGAGDVLDSAQSIDDAVPSEAKAKWAKAGFDLPDGLTLAQALAVAIDRLPAAYTRVRQERAEL